jgi:putative membrane protein
MRNIVLAAAAIALFAAPVSAQDIRAAAPAQPVNPAVKGIHENNSATPVPGANSFTESQAKSQIEAKGYTRVAGLKKGEDGVWRGTATKDGASHPVSVDYQGNVN